MTHHLHHAHRYLLASPAGPTSLGRCDCGVSREFANSVEAGRQKLRMRGDYAWNQEPLLLTRELRGLEAAT